MKLGQFFFQAILIKNLRKTFISCNIISLFARP